MNAIERLCGDGIVQGQCRRNPHDDLWALLAQLRRLEAADGSREQLLVALDRLIECAKIRFADEERSLMRGAYDRFDAYLAAHRKIIEYIMLIRQYVDSFDKFRLLQDLHYLDRLLQGMDSESGRPVRDTDNSAS